jgi:hypothetical protein
MLPNVCMETDDFVISSNARYNKSGKLNRRPKMGLRATALLLRR